MVTKKLKSTTADEVKQIIEAAIKRMSSPAEAAYWREIFTELVEYNAIPVELLTQVPISVIEAGCTRFDQLYAACMYLAFPRYSRRVLRSLLGPLNDLEEPMTENTRIWRAMFPEEYGLAHVLFRAESYQQAFSFACDYACRAHLRLNKRIPSDLTIRIAFMSEKSLRRHLKIRSVCRGYKRKKLYLRGRVFTPRQINGARLCAMGKKGTNGYEIAKYAEIRDLRILRETKKLVRTSQVEYESFQK
jgi:hypothetical protein